MSARELAYDVLKKIYSSGKYSNIAVDKALENSSLAGADRGLFTVITMGVVERQLTLDHVIDALAESPEKIEQSTRILLRMGLYQLMFLDRIPEYAVLNETVSLSPRRTRGFVNAMLRSYLRKRNNIKYPDKDSAPLEYLSVKYSFPPELCRRFCDAFGIDRTERIFDVYNGTPPMTLRINTLKISREEYCKILSQNGIEYECTENSPDGVHVRGMAYSDLTGADKGWFFVQDEASQICVKALDAQPDDFVIDACACPGSKSFGAGISMKNTGKILSCDLHKSKLTLVDKGAQRLGLDIISTREIDGRTFDGELYMSADAVLCDVPCSCLGVIAKKPEIRYKDLSQSDKLPAIQRDILENVSKYVKSGGHLVYSTCTVMTAENNGVIDGFLSLHPEFVPEDFTVGELSSENGKLSLFPDIHKTDGFFIAKLRRI